MLEHCEIKQSADGSWTAGGVRVGMTVAGDGNKRLFKRRALQPMAPGGVQECMLVGELDGVRTYVIERAGLTHIVMTRRDLYPSFVE